VSIFQEKVGITPALFTWPYSAYNDIAVEEAKKQGFRMLLTLEEGLGNIYHLDRINRYYAQNMLFWVPTFKEELEQGLMDATPIRGVQIDLDKVVDPASYEESDKNLGKCLDRLESLGVNTVIVQAFCDREGSGNVKSLYYHNTVLPVEMDFLAHAVNRIKGRGMQAFVWMPSLSFVLPDRKTNEELQVRALKNGHIRIAASSYRRLSPFAERSLAISQAIFRDLAAYVDFDGVLFQDDAYLTDEEDFHPAAAATFKKIFGRELSASSISDDSLKIKWRSLKTETINRFIEKLAKTIRTYRPSAKIARNIYSEAVNNPKSQDWFSQNLESYLRSYDYTVVMDYSHMEKIGSRARAKKWMKNLFDRVKKYNGTDKVIFKVQAFDWEKDRWIDEATIKEELTHFLALGARHIAYYPDGVVEDKPRRDAIASIISGQEFVRGIRKKGRK
jgi:biofilm PGA synthesis lipoprotein PgaB